MMYGLRWINIFGHEWVDSHHFFSQVMHSLWKGVFYQVKHSFDAFKTSPPEVINAGTLPVLWLIIKQYFLKKNYYSHTCWWECPINKCYIMCSMWTDRFTYIHNKNCNKFKISFLHPGMMQTQFKIFSISWGFFTIEIKQTGNYGMIWCDFAYGLGQFLLQSNVNRECIIITCNTGSNLGTA